MMSAGMKSVRFAGGWQDELVIFACERCHVQTRAGKQAPAMPAHF
jgi:hypothetical protein